jgi:hypothetical protein
VRTCIKTFWRIETWTTADILWKLKLQLNRNSCQELIINKNWNFTAVTNCNGFKLSALPLQLQVVFPFIFMNSLLISQKICYIHLSSHHNRRSRYCSTLCLSCNSISMHKPVEFQWAYSIILNPADGFSLMCELTLLIESRPQQYVQVKYCRPPYTIYFPNNLHSVMVWCI